MNDCWLVPPERPPCFILLGRYGDLIQLLPAFQAVFERTGHKPIVIVSTDYANVLEGVSYVTPFPVPFTWYEGIPQARKIAEERFGGGIVPQWWHDPTSSGGPMGESSRIPLVDSACRGGLVLQCHGREWGVDINRWPNYGTSMWDRAGFSAEEMRSLPLVFDRRVPGRETGLLNQARRMNTKPMLLLNFAGHSSPFGPHPEVYRKIQNWSHRFNLVDLSKYKAARIYDLLGLYERAAGLVTTDTATLHLAGAGTVPYVAYTVDGWCSSVPKGRCVLEIKYNQAIARLDDLGPVLDEWASGIREVRRATPPANLVTGGGAVMEV